MSILSRLRNLERLREPGLPVIEPLQTPLPRQIGGLSPQIGGIAPILPTILPILPTQTITLPGGQTVEIPEINMDEVNANLAAAGITPQVPQPVSVPDLQELTIEDPRSDSMSIERLPVTDERLPILDLDVNPSEGLGIMPFSPPNPMLDPNVSIPTKTPQTTSVPGTTSPSPGAEVLPAPVVRPDLGDAVSQVEPDYSEIFKDLPAPPAPREDMPFVPSVRQVATGLDPLTEQLLFGIGGEGGFIPGAMRAAEKVFFDEEGKPVVIEEQVAGFSPDQLRAQELARQGVGIQDRFISGAEGALGRGITALGEGFGRARGFAGQGLRATQAGLGDLTSGLSEQERDIVKKSIINRSKVFLI